MERVTIHWTQTAVDGLRKLPKKVRRGILDKAAELHGGIQSQSLHKPLTGPLQGYFRICYSRYRAIYKVEISVLPDKQKIERVIILFVATGIRREGDKKDIYRIAEKLLRLGILEAGGAVKSDVEEDAGQ